MSEPIEELKKKVESILFATGKKIEITEIAKLCRLSHNIPLVEQILNELREKYDKEGSSLMLVREDTAWKLTVRERYVSLVKDLVTKTDLTKTIMETLAVIAYKAPVLQSELIRIRTNKAYDHLRELEKTGYISRRKKGRTKLIELTPKFYEYFDVPPEKLKEKFKTVEELEKAVEIKEAELRDAKSSAKEKKDDSEKAKEEIKKSTEKEIAELDKVLEEKEGNLPEVDLIGKEGRKEKLDVYDSELPEGTEFEEPKSNIQVIGPKVGDLEIVELGLTAEQKKSLVEEAERLKREDEQFAKQGKEKAAAEEREKEFEKKFRIMGDEEEPGEAPSEEAGEPAEEEAPEEGQAPSEETEEAEAPQEEDEEPAEKEPEEEQPEEEKEEPEPKEERIQAGKISEEAAEQMKSQPVPSREGKRLFEKGMPKDMQERVDSRVEEIVFGKKKPDNPNPEQEGESGEKEESGEPTPERY